MQSWILSEIFAILSGDKRSLLLLDIFHARMVQATRDLTTNSTDANTHEDALDEILDAVNLLECYRVVLLQRPAMLYPFSLLTDVPAHGQTLNTDNQLLKRCSIPALLRSLVSGVGPSVPIQCARTSLGSLCALSLLSSHFSHLPGSMSKYLGPSDDLNRKAGLGWRQEFIELTMQRWLLSHVSPPSAATFMLFHAIHLSMYSNFARVQRTASNYLTSRKSSNKGQPQDQEDPNKNGARSESTPPSSAESWMTSEEDRKKAMWHANRILAVAEEMKADATENPGQRIHMSKKADGPRSGEPAHYSHAVYYASMVLWCINMSTSQPSRDEDPEKFRSSANLHMLRRAIILLSLSASQIAKVFKQTLRALQSLS